MLYAVNYADDNFRNAQKYNTKTAYQFGKVDKVFEYTYSDLSESFIKKNENILKQKKGGGYWIWKPYIIFDAMNRINEGDFLIYADSGSYYINDVHKLINVMERDNNDMMTFQVPLIERQWTKKELFDYFNIKIDSDYAESCQRIATFIVIKKTIRTLSFIEKYLEICCNESLVTDVKDESNQDSSFIDHRHDQSIFSLLCKLYDVPVYRDPSEYGIKPKLLDGIAEGAKWVDPNYRESDYPQVIVAHKRGSVTVKVRIMAGLRILCPPMFYRFLMRLIIK